MNAEMPELIAPEPKRFVAWQRLMRERLKVEEPREQIASLDGYTVGLIGRQDAIKLIHRYEYLGHLGRARIFIGLFSPYREVHGAACFGYGPSGGTKTSHGKGSIRAVIGEPALCLERGACVHYAPKNAASFLIARACKLVHRLNGVSIFYAYGDPAAGEYGAVYQAANWHYLGQGDFNRINADGKPSRRSERAYVCRPGADPDDPRNWRITYDLRRYGGGLSWAEARAQGWRIELRPAKHVYAINIGRDRAKWRREHPSLPYPAPRPSLKNGGEYANRNARENSETAP